MDLLKQTLCPVDRLTLALIICFQDTFISKEKKGSPLLSVFFFIPESEKELEREILKDLERKILIVSFSEAKWLLTGGEEGCAGTLRPAKRQR